MEEGQGQEGEEAVGEEAEGGGEGGGRGGRRAERERERVRSLRKLTSWSRQRRSDNESMKLPHREREGGGRRRGGGVWIWKRGVNQKKHPNEKVQRSYHAATERAKCAGCGE